MHDMCASEAAGSCAGEVQLAAAVTLPIDTDLIAADVLAALTGDDVDTDTLNDSPFAAPIKSSLAGALGVDVGDITITKFATTSRRLRRLQAGLSVDYVVSLPAVEAVTAKAASETMVVPDVVIPAAVTESGTAITIAQADIVAAPLRSYAYVKTSMCSASVVCSNECGTTAVTADDYYTCEEDSAAVDTAVCEAVLGAAPATETECCPAADEDYCEESDDDLADPPCPPGYATNADLSAEEKARCGYAEIVVKAKDNAAVVIVIVIVVVLALLVLAYKLCCSDSDDSDSNDSRGDVEKGAAVEAQENEEERRKKLEDRLAKVRDTIDEAP